MAKQTEEEKHEAAVVEGMTKAFTIAEQLFGAQVNTCAVEEIYDYLEIADEEDFLIDLKQVIEHTKKIYKTTAPTPEQVFGVFERIYGDEDDDE